MAIRCCNGCVPPKRHLNCHSTCKEYIKEKTKWKEDKKKIRENLKDTPRIRIQDYNETDLIRTRRHKKGHIE